MNLGFRLSRSSFRSYLHRTADVDAILADHGLVPTLHRTTLIWQPGGLRVSDGLMGSAGRGDDPADGWFPESVAADYDEPGGANAPEVVGRAVDVLDELAGGGPVLEFAVGTGRIAAPLAARGVPVSGIELSRAMAARIADKPGGDAVDVTIGDMTSTRVAGEFSLVYLVFNTISNVTTQDGQVDVFGNAAAHLRPGGLFLIEVGVPGLRRLPPGQDTVPFTVAPDGSRAVATWASTSTTW